ncbi:MAG: DUF1573 domain-containing protein [Bacteroidetes bacterium]|uniref:DUF1573 domain-containing protein n=1 Tax=Phaeocystidibacter marisrubri TaxID=1577780 RepID=A0A6L3ZIY2_9FLAO|nr:DUF1573 domain-containing protein [Phaeocystidibacter marisrubri]KAB2817841.1 DUF1573 domain-containing protein [Phaeocystidibacter marisrubri]TNE29477.1 MAG: DUF1573 domain-containing protein [Bacteroidota bacterium]GGH73256.1 hypothetical protein GCM10011318_18090 [Phaeocystidibacter marisrubri]
MKLSISALAVVAAMGLASCDSAVSKIDNSSDASSVSYESMEEGGNQVTAADVNASGTPKFQFNEMKWDFGNIVDGDVVEHVFEFVNSGDAPLIISNARGSCGCTVPEWPRTPIAPGESGSIKVSFSSAGKVGNPKKQVTITSNAVPNTTVLNIEATVAPKPAAE